MHDTLHELAQTHALKPAQTRALWHIAGIDTPPPRAQQSLRHALMLVAALLLGAGLIFWVAAHWDAQTRLFKLHVLQAAVAAPLLIVLCLPDKASSGRGILRVSLTMLGMLAIGGLLALIGITYQTGADAWELFATWALLAAPLVLALRHDWLLALWLLIVAVALTLWGSGAWAPQSGQWLHRRNTVLPLLWLLVFVTPLVAAGWLRDVQGKTTRALVSWPLAALLAVGTWTVQGCKHILFSPYGEVDWVGIVLNTVLVLGAAYVGRYSRWRDMVVLMLAVLALNVLALCQLGEVLSRSGMGKPALLLFSLLAMLSFGMSAHWLHRQQEAVRPWQPEPLSEAQQEGDAA